MTQGSACSLAGPFWCAQDDIEIALSSCMVKPELISVAELVAITYTTALSKSIDYPSHLSSDRVFLFSGTLDTVVDPGKARCTQQVRPGVHSRSGQAYTAGQARRTQQVRPGVHSRSGQAYTAGQARRTQQVRPGVHSRSGQAYTAGQARRTQQVRPGVHSRSGQAYTAGQARRT